MPTANKPTLENRVQFVSNASSVTRTRSSAIARLFQTALWLLPFLLVWGVSINQLRVEWSVNPQYSYGWLVPLLCAGLLARVLQSHKFTRQPSEARSSALQRSTVPFLGFALLAFLWLPTRLVQDANPEWRLISWALGIEVVGLTLLFVWLTQGSSRATQLVVPVCFFLVAVPWPTSIERSVVQGLTRANVATTVELLNWLAIPANQHNNVVEISTGVVGLTDACSGIRSFQSSIMISLFLGELYGLLVWRRLLLLSGGILLAFLFNVCRTSLLVWVASTKGIPAIESWHDPAGISITIACTLGLWALAALLLRRNEERKQAEPTSHGLEPEMDDSGVRNSESKQTDSNGDCHSGSRSSAHVVSPLGDQARQCRRISFAFLAWLVVVEVGVEAWYRIHELHIPKSASWTIQWPRGNPTFAELPIAQITRQLLRYDEGSSANWRETDGTQWQMIYLRWQPGRVAVHLAKTHTPEVCLKAAGLSVAPVADLEYLPVQGLRLPFRMYRISEQDEPVVVFYCLWEDRATEQSFQTRKLTYGGRLDPVLAGRRNCGQRSLEIVIRGIDDLSRAKAAVIRQLDKLIRIESPPRSQTSAVSDLLSFAF